MSIVKQNPAERLAAVQDRIDSACLAANRPISSVRLLAVSKTQPVGKIRDLALLGQIAFGESYVDEALEKMAKLTDCNLEWHFIGPLQSNKTRAIAAHFDWVQSVDRAKLVRRLAQQRTGRQAPLNLLIQVNLDGESQKAGCDPADIGALAGLIAEHPELRLRGLMAIPAPRESVGEQRVTFGKLRALFDQLAERYPEIDTLSAGMSDDLEAAIAEGSGMVRVGTALFGPRPRP
jgi:pyridoxal phosphate enzyme (YggS family)